MDSRNRKNITLADVAKAAGVATMTVSRYLNGHPNITDKTARKVKASIDALGYRPNQAARMLMGQPSRVIGLILPNLANPFFSSIAHSVQQTAHARGYLVWIAATNGEADIDLQLIERMRDHHVDGILLTASHHTTLRPRDLGDIPLIALERPVRIPPGTPQSLVDFIKIEDRNAAREAVEHLISHGYRRIACFGLDSKIHSIEERILGYQEAMRAHNLTPLPYVQCEDKPSAIRVIRKLMSGSAPVQAIFPANGAATILALEALDELHYSVPDKVALFSFGDIPLARIFRPQISAVRQPTELLGEIATRHLLDLIATRSSTTGIRISIPASQVIRESCGCHRLSKADKN
ncbi:MAG: LacI family DNA-binding transcriptional regulator [Granulicella sp.]